MNPAPALATVFAAFGQPASWYPANGGGPIACTVILDALDAIHEFGGVSRTVMPSAVLEVRASEVSLPGRDDLVLLSDGRSLFLLEHPEAKDPDRLVWTCSATRK